ncbi:hypothetical protein [Halothiobacillus sp. DCM-1]|uniref:hypothetical protein n=1 Tax=Halothiobacillus sp. DCM-1 TaxID=3112558 RepID=UPI003249A33D
MSSGIAANRKRILLLCSDVVGKQMAGTAIRSVEIAKTLSFLHDVTLLAADIGEHNFRGFKLNVGDSTLVKHLAFQSDIVIFQGDSLSRYPFLKDIEGVLIADLYCPIPLEYHMSTQTTANSTRLDEGWRIARMMQEQLIWADHFLCASQRQMDFWAGALTLAGRINPLSMPSVSDSNFRHFFSVVPFGFPDELPKNRGTPIRDKFNIPRDEFLMVWGGGIYEWFDPVTILKAVARLEIEGTRVHLVFMGIKHPNPTINPHDRVGLAVEYSRQLGVIDRLVHFNFGWVDYDVRHEYLMDADVGVSAHLDNMETRFSFRTRMLDYLWCGLPILSTKGDEFGDLISARGLGVSVNYEDVDDWCLAIRQMMKPGDFFRGCKRAVSEVRAEYTWSNVTKPLQKACVEISPSKDRAYIRLRAKEMGYINDRFRGVMARVRSVYQRFGFWGLARAIWCKFLKTLR